MSFLDGVLRGECPDSSGLGLPVGVVGVAAEALPFYRYQVVLRSLLQATSTLGARHVSLLDSWHSAPCVGGGSFPSYEGFLSKHKNEGVLKSIHDLIISETVAISDGTCTIGRLELLHKLREEEE